MPNDILIIEDDPDIADAVAYALQQEGLRATVARDGRAGLEQFAAIHPDLVILDLMLPGLDGFSVFRSIRRKAETPVIMLTAKAAEADRVAGLELGADDYVTKPFSMRELVARVRGVLRRASTPALPEEETLSAADVVIDRARRRVTVGGREVKLTLREFALLECLVRNAGRVLTRQLLLEQAWDESEYIDHRTVDVHVRWVRQKIEEDPSNPRRLLTVRGVGYRFVE
ncbi:MAG: response regulator transcription factor [Armatimonadetes bacterium]|nr:response regulator transcription factor [Armatimonadota bacterium]